MHRRGFFQTLAGVLGTAVLDPERLLWVPGRKTIFLPPVVALDVPTGFLLTPEWITTEALRTLEHSLAFSRQITRKYDAMYPIRGERIATMAVRIPQRYS